MNKDKNIKMFDDKGNHTLPYFKQEVKRMFGKVDRYLKSKNKKYNKLRDDAYQLYYNDEISEEEYDDKVKELNKEHRKEMYMSSPNIDAQIRPQREQMMQDDGKLYKEGKLSKEDLKRLYPRFWQDIIRIQDNK